MDVLITTLVAPISDPARCAWQAASSADVGFRWGGQVSD